MEKTRFCCGGLFSAFILALLVLTVEIESGVAATKTLEVSVDVPIKAGNSASALEDAKLEAFKKALEQSFSSSMDEVEKSKRVKNASDYVKSFELISKKEEGGRIYANYKVELNLPDEGSVEQTGGFQDVYAIELNWKPKRDHPSLASLRRELEASYAAKLTNARLNRGSFWIEMATRQSPQVVYQSVSNKYSQIADVKLFLDPQGIFGGEGQTNFFPSSGN